MFDKEKFKLKVIEKYDKLDYKDDFFKINVDTNNSRHISNYNFYNKNKYTWKYYFQKFIISIVSIILALVGGISVYAFTGGKIGGKPALEWFGIVFSDDYEIYRKDVDGQEIKYNETTVDLVGVVCDEGFTTLEFDVKLSEEDKEFLRIGKTLWTEKDEAEEENAIANIKKFAENEIKEKKYNEEIQKGNFDINIYDIEISQEEFKEYYEEHQYKSYKKHVDQLKNHFNGVALDFNIEQYDENEKDPIYGFQKYYNIYIDGKGENAKYLQSCEKVSENEYIVYQTYLLTDDILQGRNTFTISLKNNKLKNVALENEEDMNSRSKIVNSPNNEREMFIPGEFNVEVSKEDLLANSIVLDNIDKESVFHNITHKVEKVTLTPIQTVIKINKECTKQYTSLILDRSPQNDDIEYMPFTRKYKIYDENGKELKNTYFETKRLITYSNGKQEEWATGDIVSTKTLDNATMNCDITIILEKTDTKVIKIVPIEEVRENGKVVDIDMEAIEVVLK